jgi:hypothetical protein
MIWALDWMRRINNSNSGEEEIVGILVWGYTKKPEEIRPEEYLK